MENQIKDFPKEVIEKMLERQVEQGNKRDVTVFEKSEWEIKLDGGFDWDKTIEGDEFWREVIDEKNFALFFEKYPKQEQEGVFIPLPEKQMWVCDGALDKEKRVVFGKKIIKGKVNWFAWSSHESIECAKKTVGVVIWENASEITKELTKQEAEELLSKYLNEQVTIKENGNNKRANQ